MLSAIGCHSDRASAHGWRWLVGRPSFLLEIVLWITLLVALLDG